MMARADHLDERADPHSPWYARWWLRMRRSKYAPHQSTRERTRVERRAARVTPALASWPPDLFKDEPEP